MIRRERMARKRLVVARCRQQSKGNGIARGHNPKPSTSLYIRAIERRKDRTC